ncbi:MAG: hypothetical protein MMC33_008235 [Icmadophila ericetorum]|nr:hypothetical protein [Icmadophila ericetorum]
MPQSATILPPGMRDPSRRTFDNPILKDTIYMEKYGAETNGEYIRFRVTVAPGGGPHLHRNILRSRQRPRKPRHRRQRHHLNTSEHGSRSHRHYSSFLQRPRRQRYHMRGGNSSGSRGLREVFVCDVWAGKRRANAGGGKMSLMQSCNCAELGALRIPGGIGNWVIKSVAAWGRWMGEEQRLLEKYWY